MCTVPDHGRMGPIVALIMPSVSPHIQRGNPDRVDDIVQVHHVTGSQYTYGSHTPLKKRNNAGSARQFVPCYYRRKEGKPSILATVTPHVFTHVWTAPMGGVCSSIATGTDTIATYAIGRYPIGHMHYTRRWVVVCVYICMYVYVH